MPRCKGRKVYARREGPPHPGVPKFLWEYVMIVHVDQSNKIETTNKPSVLAMASSNLAVPTVRTVLVPAGVKQRGLATLEHTRHWGATRGAVALFTAATYILVEPHLARIDRLQIDPEYTGHEELIRSWLIDWARRRAAVDLREVIVFQPLGRGSPAHEAALRAARQRRADVVLHARQLLELLV